MSLGIRDYEYKPSKKRLSTNTKQIVTIYDPNREPSNTKYKSSEGLSCK